MKRLVSYHAPRNCGLDDDVVPAAFAANVADRLRFGGAQNYRRNDGKPPCCQFEQIRLVRVPSHRPRIVDYARHGFDAIQPSEKSVRTFEVVPCGPEDGEGAGRPIDGGCHPRRRRCIRCAAVAKRSCKQRVVGIELGIAAVRNDGDILRVASRAVQRFDDRVVESFGRRSGRRRTRAVRHAPARSRRSRGRGRRRPCNSWRLRESAPAPVVFEPALSQSRKLKIADLAAMSGSSSGMRSL